MTAIFSQRAHLSSRIYGMRADAWHCLMLIQPARKLLHDADTYADPLAFNPDRFVRAPGREPETDPRQFVFGFGRRWVPVLAHCTPRLIHHSICPGRHFAMDALFLSIASILHVFDIQPPIGPDGHPQRVEPKINLDHALA